MSTALLGFFLASCGPTQKAAGPTKTDEPKIKEHRKNIAALKIKEDVKKKYQAVIFGTDASGGSTLIPLAGKESRTKIDAMWVRRGGFGRPATGGSSETWLVTAPQSDNQVRVGVYEQYAGGIGAQFRAAVWLSSFVASTMLGKDLTDFRFAAEAKGYIDGPSAGALMTAGYLASLTGAKVDPKATMTGTVNPDGTVGPVGGIPQKFEGSIAKGKTRLGYPVGIRYSHDINKRKKVDLEELARNNNVKASEIADVYEAYEFITGKKLPRPVPVSEREMALGHKVEKELIKYYKEWQGFLKQQWGRIIALYRQGNLPYMLQSLASLARRQGQEAEKLLQQGIPGMAYQRVIEAVIYATAATSVAEIFSKIKAGDISGAQATLRQVEKLSDLTEATLRKVGDLKPTTMGGHLQMVSAFQLAIAGWGFHSFGARQMRRAHSSLYRMRGKTPEQLATTATQNAIVRGTAPAILTVLRGIAASQAAKQALSIEGVDSLNYMCSLPNARRLATSYSSAAAANLAYYESLFVPDPRRRYMALLRNPDYLTAYMASKLPQFSGGIPAKLKKEWGEKSLPWSLGALSGSILSYFKASILISKGYSLRVKNNRMGRPSKLQHEKAFINMITNAERKARENAHAAKVAAGSIPIQAKLNYQKARYLREGDLADKLKALELFWESSVYSQTAVALARN